MVQRFVDMRNKLKLPCHLEREDILVQFRNDVLVQNVLKQVQRSAGLIYINRIAQLIVCGSVNERFAIKLAERGLNPDITKREFSKLILRGDYGSGLVPALNNCTKEI